MSRTPPHTFNIDWAAAAEAKAILGIEHPIEFAFAGPFWGNFGWLDVWTDGDDPGEVWQILMRPNMAPEFASMIVWHELAHARQMEQDYADPRQMLLDYEQGSELIGVPIGGDGSPAPWSADEVRAYALLPWESEANLTAWENRMMVLTRPTRRSSRRPKVAGPQNFVEYLGLVDLDFHEIMDIGTEYREGMRI